MKPIGVTSNVDLVRMRKEATEAWQKQDYAAYFKIMEQASRENPANPSILQELGFAHGMRYDYASAERCFEKAVRVAPNKSEALVTAATQCRAFDRYDMTRHYLERAVKETKVSPYTLVKLAEVYERFRLHEQAGEWVDRALRMDPGCAMASLVRARLDRLGGKTEEAERRLRSFLAQTGKDTWSTRIRGWYEMGTVLDAQGRYDEAMAAFLEAKSMILPNAAQCIAAQKRVQSDLKIVEEQITAEMVNRWKEQATALQPPVRLALLCGHPRSGTTLLEQVLDSHPDLISAEETRIFLQEAYRPLLRHWPQDHGMVLQAMESASTGALLESRQNYTGSMEKFMRQPLNTRMLIDKNPALTCLAPAFIRIFPEAKLLVALRDPRDICLSCFMQPLPLGQVSSIYLTLESTIQEYASVMGLWKAAAPCLGDSYMEIRYEDLVMDLEGVARRALAFLGASWDERVLRFNEHASQKLVRSPTYAAVARPISRGAMGRWRPYQKYFEPWLETLAPFIEAFGYH